MVCPDVSTFSALAENVLKRCIEPTGGSPVRVSAGAPGSRPQAKAEMPTVGAGRQKPLKEKGATRRAVTHGERCSHVIVSAERCWEGRAGHVTAKATDSSLDRNDCWTFPGYGAVARFQRRARNRRDPTWEIERSREGVRGAQSTHEGAQDNALEGRGPALIELGRR